jgi:hypothetical protein
MACVSLSRPFSESARPRPAINHAYFLVRNLPDDLLEEQAHLRAQVGVL